MNELYCAFCMQRGNEVYGDPVYNKAITIINGHATCEMVSHMVAAEHPVFDEAIEWLRQG